MQYSNVVINLVGKDTETLNFSHKDVHVDGARRIARLARECGVEKLIHFSALNATEKPKKAVLRKFLIFNGLPSKHASFKCVKILKVEDC